MLDTVVLTLESNQYRIFEPERFTPNPRLFSVVTKPLRFTNNPSKRADVYYPRLTLTYRPNISGTTRTLRVEFSAPKLIFGNNFDELFEYEFKKVAETLQLRLRDMGVVVTRSDLAEAMVSTIHYSKNLAFTDGTTSRILIDIISKANSTKRREVNQREYRNNGYAFRWHTTSYEVIYYDKVADLLAAKQTQKGRIEQDNGVQLSLLDDLKDDNPFEVMRIEVRLNTRRKMSDLFKKLHIEKRLVFSELFDKSISKQIVLHFWNEMVASLPPPSTRQKSIASRLRSLTTGKDPTAIRTAIFLTGLEALLNEAGMTGARALVNELASDHQWQYMLRQLKESKGYRDSEHAAIKRATALLENYTPVSLMAFDDVNFS